MNRKYLLFGILAAAAVGGLIFSLKYLERLKPVGPVKDFYSLFENLRSIGARAEIVDVNKIIKDRLPEGATYTQNPLAPFSVPRKIININGKGMSVFEYLNSQEAEKEAELISADGRRLREESIPLCAGPTARPHFFRKEKIIVLYVLDDDKEILDFLSHLLGPQFAGI